MSPAYKFTAPGTFVNPRTVYKSMLVGNASYIPGNYESIATTTVGAGGSSSVTFSSIPSTYTHLQIRVMARGNYADTFDSFFVRANGDTGNNYTLHNLSGNGSSASAGAVAPYGAFRGTELTGATATSGQFGICVVDILDYLNTNKYKTARILGGVDKNGSGAVGLFSGVWMNGNAITSLTITPVFGSSFVQYSHFALYGIKVA